MISETSCQYSVKRRAIFSPYGQLVRLEVCGIEVVRNRTIVHLGLSCLHVRENSFCHDFDAYASSKKFHLYRSHVPS